MPFYGREVPFQSTLPARGATVVCNIFLVDSRNFNPRSPRGERLYTVINTIRRVRFQSTLPARGATCLFPAVGVLLVDFNPRSPRGERRCDNNTIVQVSPFQSTLPARGATVPIPKQGAAEQDFNPRSPRGERLWHYGFHLPVLPFQSTLPARGATTPIQYLTLTTLISIHAPREGSDSNIAQIFTIRTAILQHGYQTRLVFGTKSIVLNRKKSFKLPVFLREPTGLFMFTSGSRHGRSKNQRVGHIYGGACTDVLNLSLI